MRRRCGERARAHDGLDTTAGAGRSRPLALLAVGALVVRGLRQRARQSRRAGNSRLPSTFLDQAAGFGLNQSFIPYSPLSSYGRALLVGLVNTHGGVGAGGRARHADRFCRRLRAAVAQLGAGAAGGALCRDRPQHSAAAADAVLVCGGPVALAGTGGIVAFCRRAAQQSRPGPAGAGFRAGRRLGRGLARSRGHPGVFLAALGAREAGDRRRLHVRAVAMLLLLAPGLIAFFAMGRPIHFDLSRFRRRQEIPSMSKAACGCRRRFSRWCWRCRSIPAPISPRSCAPGCSRWRAGQSEAAAALGLSGRAGAQTGDPAAGHAHHHAAADQPISGAGEKLLARRLCRLRRPDAGLRHHPQPDRRRGAGDRAGHGDLSRPVAGDAAGAAACTSGASPGARRDDANFFAPSSSPPAPPPPSARRVWTQVR